MAADEAKKQGMSREEFERQQVKTVAVARYISLWSSCRPVK